MEDGPAGGDPDLVVVGASAGGVTALRALAAGIPPGLRAPVLVVLHLPVGARSALPQILTRAGHLPAGHPRDGEELRPGQIFVAPPDHHLSVVDGRMRLTHGPEENGHRPAIDPLFRSAARCYGARAIGVVLSGTLDDGAAGQIEIAARGGRTIVQDPADAIYAGMPLSVLQYLRVDHVVPAVEIGPLLGRLVGTMADPARLSTSSLPREEWLAMDDPFPDDDDLHGAPAGIGCPQCGGSVDAIDEGGLLRYRCRIGHAWSPGSLLAKQREAMEAALWLAVRTLEDRAEVCRRSERAALERGNAWVAERYA
ncbi:MAG TPA: chemotaxis protein CheB, partial [Kineosporiaceae bacterium]